MNCKFVTDFDAPCLSESAEQPQAVFVVCIEVCTVNSPRNCNIRTILKIAVHFRSVVCFIRFSENLSAELNIIDAADICNSICLFLAEIRAVNPAVCEVGAVFKIISRLISADDICLKSGITPHCNQ